MNISLEERIAKIEKRNARVESEKAWEMSGARLLCNGLTTYLLMNLLLWTIGGPFPPLHALIPTAGYLLSALSIPAFKKRWIARHQRRFEEETVQ